MDWLQPLFEQISLTFLSVFIPTILVVVFFIFAAHRAHIKHVERLEKIKQGYFLSDDD